MIMVETQDILVFLINNPERLPKSAWDELSHLDFFSNGAYNSHAEYFNWSIISRTKPEFVLTYHKDRLIPSQLCLNELVSQKFLEEFVDNFDKQCWINLSSSNPHRFTTDFLEKNIANLTDDHLLSLSTYIRHADQPLQGSSLKTSYSQSHHQ